MTTEMASPLILAEMPKISGLIILKKNTIVTLGTLWLNRFFIGVNEYDSYEMLTFASWKTKVC